MRRWSKIGIFLLLCGAVLLCFSLGISRLEQGRRQEGIHRLEQTLRRTAAACYAVEGFYPPSLAYMQQHYALQYNEDAYVVYYEVFASNLMPDITVLEKGS